MSDELELAYLAGLFDGEGCVGIYGAPMKGDRARRSWRLSVSVSSTDRPTCDSFHARFGGHIGEHTATSKKRTYWRWEVQGTVALTFLATMLPFLRYKRPQAEAALRFTMPTAHQDGLTGRYAPRTDAADIAALAASLREMKHAGAPDHIGIKGLRRVV